MELKMPNAVGMYSFIAERYKRKFVNLFALLSLFFYLLTGRLQVLTILFTGD